MLNVMVVKYTIPLFGNTRSHPYGTLLINDGATTKLVKFGYKMKDGAQVDYITFNRKRYYYTINSVYPFQIVIKE